MTEQELEDFMDSLEGISDAQQSRYNLGDTVYLKTDPEQLERIVTGILIRPGGSVTYYLTVATTETFHYAMEMTPYKDYTKS